MTDNNDGKNDPADSATEARTMRVRNIYFNGFQIGASFSDMNVMILIDGQIQARLNMSFTTAKTLASELTKAVGSFEKATDHNVMTMEEVKRGYDSVGNKL